MADQDTPDIKGPKIMLAGDIRWGFAWGLVLVVAGVALLLDHMGVPAFAHISRFWPLLLVLLGVMSITSHGGRGFGLVLICAGILLQLNSLDLIQLTSRDFWPLVIIAVGVLLIWGSLETRRYGRKKLKIKRSWLGDVAREEFEKQAGDSQNDPDTLNAIAVFGGCERKYSGQSFRGGKAVSVFGAVELDFRDADIDEEAILEVDCIFGAIEMRIPETWHVHSRSLPVFGGFEDKTRERTVPDPSGSTKRKTLVITGSIVFGAVEIKN